MSHEQAPPPGVEDRETASQSTPDEAHRLQSLYRLRILDTAAEPPFDRIVEILAELFDVPNVGIHLLDDERQWVKAFKGQEYSCPREDSICQFTIAQQEIVNLSDVREDARLADLGAVSMDDGIRFYAGAPMFTRDGAAVGTLCLIDTEPREALTPEQERSLQAFAQLVVETMELRVDYHMSQRHLQAVVEIDPTTGLLNRSALLRNTLQRLEGITPPAGIVALQVRLDRVNLVTRALGGSGRSSLLRMVGERLKRLVTSDEQLARGDGDAFSLTAVRHQPDGPALAEWAHERAHRILDRLAEPYEVDGEVIYISATVGAARFDGETPPYYAVDAADAAALVGQEMGGNRVAWFTPEAFTDFQDRLSLENALREAVTTGSLELAYQPIIDLAAGGHVVGVEALVRWPHDGWPQVGPERFIPVAEEIGLIHELGMWVVDAACADLAAWRGRGWQLWVSINLSPVQLREPTLVEDLVARVRAQGVEPSDIKLEITESALATEFDAVQTALQRLHEAGFRLALDDFGTGHSSLARVIRLPFDTIKVDRGFVWDCPEGAGAAVVASLADLARMLTMDAVAEGVETMTHESFLRDHDYKLVQGYYYAHPMPAVEIEALFDCPRAHPQR